MLYIHENEKILMETHKKLVVTYLLSVRTLILHLIPNDFVRSRSTHYRERNCTFRSSVNIACFPILTCLDVNTATGTDAVDTQYGITRHCLFNRHHKTGMTRLIRESDTRFANFWMWTKERNWKKKKKKQKKNEM